ncbi:hypothetical protein BD410DRAFT_808942 [Rickenella mellea]|uniref:Uncharacterized protein n=1 Tax=Rickenella mellea TaxID=50990 RepID=A0A4Y7PIW5_9AGAM|nr:hypothetical protein BD410DRAFT_808942 [Rickenella mellea]
MTTNSWVTIHAKLQIQTPRSTTRATPSFTSLADATPAMLLRYLRLFFFKIELNVVALLFGGSLLLGCGTVAGVVCFISASRSVDGRWWRGFYFSRLRHEVELRRFDVLFVASGNFTQELYALRHHKVLMLLVLGVELNRAKRLVISSNLSDFFAFLSTFSLEKYHPFYVASESHRPHCDSPSLQKVVNQLENSFSHSNVEHFMSTPRNERLVINLTHKHVRLGRN